MAITDPGRRSLSQIKSFRLWQCFPLTNSEVASENDGGSELEQNDGFGGQTIPRKLDSGVLGIRDRRIHRLLRGRLVTGPTSSGQ